ncbi:MAG: ATP-binding cassette domain-containing protein, partial [Pedobacter sp.]|nr:ATP-binding cassette domain-containing protein [Pedobacter sp.]
AGKTCLVRIALGLLQPDAGQREVRAGLRLGYMPQKLGLNEALPLDVQRFLALAAPRLGYAGLALALEEVGAAHVMKTPLARLSGGELQRVLLARALLRQPDLLVLDEPAQGVDITGQEELYALIARARDERGCGVLMVSHDLHLVMAATDHVLCLNRHVCCEGHPESVSAHPEYLRLFGMQGAKGLAVYSHHHDHHHDAHGEVCTHEGPHEHI